MLNDKDIDALTSLGLTILQARVYLALTHIEKATIKSIAKNANIARQDIYRLTNELQKIGIIEKIISTPAQYKAIPLEDGIKILLQRKNKENSEAQKKAIDMIMTAEIIPSRIINLHFLMVCRIYCVEFSGT